jgi:hypothetical protein
LPEIITNLEQKGFEVGALIEPAFEKSEKLVFEDAGKPAEDEELAGVAAIYILKL